MTVTAHSLVGASIATKIPNPFLGISLAIFSNFILDMIPHWDTGTNWRKRPLVKTFFFTAIDVILGMSAAFLIFYQKTNPLYLLTVIFCASLPDWLEAPYLFLAWDFPPFSWFYRIQSKFHAKDGSFGGIITQIMVVLPIVAFASMR